MSKKNVRVVIPKNASKMVTLAKKVIAKHTLDGVASPLAVIDMTDMIVKNNLADSHEVAADQLHKDAEAETEARNKVLGKLKSQGSTTEGTIYFYLTSARDVLLGKFKGKEQALGEWGFQVDTSIPPKPKPKTP